MLVRENETEEWTYILSFVTNLHSSDKLEIYRTCIPEHIRSFFSLDNYNRIYCIE